jgi:hypothetical protein
LGNRIKRIGNKYYDTGTSNKSFLQVAKDLKSLGIHNYYFMLEIYDYSLVNIDPYAENLTRDQISRIMTECTRNPWYYLREICRIPDQGGVGIPFKANRGNIAQTWLTLHGIDSWLCLPRQQGKTISFLCLLAWAYSFGTNNSTFIFVNKDSGNAKENLQRLKDIIDCLPEFLRFDQIMEEDENGKVKLVKAARNATSMKHPITKNRIIIKPKATSYESALSLARGLTSPILHFDEPEFTPYIKTIIENSVSTFETASRNAKKNGAMYCRAFSCTPGDLDTSMGQEAQEVLSHTTKWSEHMYDMRYDSLNDDKNELLQYVKNNGGNGIVYIEYSYKQLGLTDEWLRNMYNKIQNPVVVKREILLQRIRGSSDSPFDQEDIEYMASMVKPIVDELYLCDHFRFDIYKKLERLTPYLVSIDCSTGTNGDSNAITIINPYTVRPDAEFKCPYIGETQFEKLIIELVQEHLPRACIIIERNSVGDGIIDHLLNSPIRSNLYFDKNKDLVESNLAEQSNVVSMLKRQGDQKKFYGVYTDNKSREDMMAILFRRVAEFKDDFVTKNITDDIAHLVRFKSGKVAAQIGFHDDSIMSYLIGMYVWYHGNNLSMWGIVKGAKEIENQNQGLHRSVEDIENMDILPADTIEAMKRQEKVRKENDYEKIMREALIKAQRESLELHRKGLVENETLDKSQDVQLEEIYGNNSIDMSFFDEMNGMGSDNGSSSNLSNFDFLNGF